MFGARSALPDPRLPPESCHLNMIVYLTASTDDRRIPIEWIFAPKYYL